MTTPTSAHKAVPSRLVFLAGRWKAVAATVVPLLGGVAYLASTGQFDLAHLAGLVAIALGSGGVTHIVPNLDLSEAAAAVIPPVVPVVDVTLPPGLGGPPTV